MVSFQNSIARDYVQETSDIQFVMFCDEETDINLVRLLDELKRFDFNEVSYFSYFNENSFIF